MSSELVVDVQPKEISIALLENNRLVELQKEARNISFSVGDIYLGRVKKLMPGLNAAFVDVGYEKDAFLHYLDLGTQYNSSARFLKQSLSDRKRVLSLPKFNLLPDIEKDGTINDALKVGQEVLVQIAKEPISSKGPRLTAEISFAGRFLVLIPFSDKVSVSQKIKSNEEKLRLRQLIQSIKPHNFGVIVRTVAEGKRVAELNNELKTLVKCWEDMLVKLQKAQVPSLVYEETGRTVGILRDIFSPSFESIYVNDKETYNQIYNYVSLISPERKDIVKLYEGDLPIFDNFAITKQIKSSLGKTVSFKSGAYVIIEHTEALHVIDVNSGNRSKASSDQESNALDVNMNAAEEIARQLRLRDMGVEDFKLLDPELMKGMLAQRLFRKICPYCRIAAKDQLTNPTVMRLREAYGDVGLEHAFLRGPGCKHCDFRGVKGRTVIGEFILPDATFLELMIKGEQKKAINYWKNELGGRTLRENTHERMLQGIIDIDEAERWTGFLNDQIT